MALSISFRYAGFYRAYLVAAVGTLFSGLLWAQAPTKSYIECNHDSLITVLRAYEDSLASASSATVVRVDYAWRVTDVAVVGKVYKIYRCEALYDSLIVLMDAVDFARATPPVVDTDSISGMRDTTAVFHAKVTSNGGEGVTAQWFRYGTSAASLVDSAGVTGTATPFTASVSTLTAGTTYYVAGFARNAKGTAPGDTLSFTTSAPPFTCGTSTVTYDGYNYATVQIGSQCWFKENLRNDDYNDATAIPGNLDDATWTTTTSGAQTVYGEGSSFVSIGSSDEAANLATYGRLYNWYAVNTGKLCPTGWHVPTDAEWTTLETALGGLSVAGTALKVSSSNTPAWDGNNSSGFSALPGGSRDYGNGDFDSPGSGGYWWSSSPYGADAWNRVLLSGDSNVYRDDGSSTRLGFSVRCVRN